MQISSSALTAQRLRMDVISSNMANVDTTRGKLVEGEWEPYKRKMVVMQPQNSSFTSFLNKAMNAEKSASNGNGVKVTRIVEDESPNRLVFDPEHPDANEDGYVQLPNVDPLREMVDLISTTRSYEANVTVLNSSKAMLMKALEIGR
jgi:flagellar basal-body rod protein FlgC